MKKDELEIKQAEVWYTYSTYLTHVPCSLEALAKALLVTNITTEVFSSDGSIYYFENGKYKQESPEYKLKADRTNASFSLKNFPKASLSKECIYECFVYRYFQQNLLSMSDDKYIDTSYIRFLLGEIVFRLNNVRYHLYPFVTIYYSKAVIIEYRCIIDYAISLGDFIKTYMPLPSAVVEDCFASTNITKLFDENFVIDNTETFTDAQEDFIFNLIRFIPVQDFSNLNQISNCIWNGIFFKLNSFIKKEVFQIGCRWFERTDIHILELNKNYKSSNQIIEKHFDEIQQLLFLNDNTGSIFMYYPNLSNLRQFDDYLYYFFSHRSLTVHKGNKSRKDNLNTVFSTQVINHYLSFYNVLFEGAFQNILSTDNYADLLHFQEDLLLLDKDTVIISHYGEINDLISHAEKELGIEKKKELVKSLLDSQKNIIDNKRSILNNKITFYISIIFGLISSSTVSQDLIIPLWNILKIPKPNDDLTKLISYLLSFVIVTLSLVPLFKMIKKMKFFNH